MSGEQVKPGYKRTEVGVIPEDWEVSTVGDVITSFQNGFAFASAGYVKIGIPIVTMAQIGLNGDFNFNENQANYWPIKEASGLVSYMLFRGDIIIAMTDVTPQKNLIGRMAEVRGKGPFLLNQRVGLLRLNSEKINPYFLRLISNSEKWRGYARGAASLGVQANIGTKDICSGKIPLPSLNEQRAIATALSDVDALLAKLDQLIAKKRDLKQATMQQLLTGQTRLPGFSGDWEVKRLGDVADVDPESLSSETSKQYGFKYISLEDVDSGILKNFSEQFFATAPSRARRRLRVGDVLVSTVRPNLMSHLLFNEAGPDWICSTGFSVIRCQNGKSHSGFVFAHLFGRSIAKQIETLVTGSNYPAINSRDVRAFEIAMPSYSEQTAIATVLSDMDAELAALESRRDKTRALKQSMMQELLTGRIRLI